MKKLFIFLILFTLFIVPAYSERSDYIGTWFTANISDKGMVASETFTLTADGVAYYSNALFKAGEPLFNRQYVGIWRYTSDGIRIKYGDSFDEVAAFVAGDYLLLDNAGSYISFTKYTEYTAPIIEPDLSQAPDILTVVPTDQASVILPPGTYHGGVDVLPGTYTVKGNTSGEFVSMVYINRNDPADVGSYVLRGDDTIQAFTITDGHEFKVFNGFLILNQVKAEP